VPLQREPFNASRAFAKRRSRQNQAVHGNRSGNRAAVSDAGFFSFSYAHARELENLTRDIIARTRPHCLRALADAKLEAKDLDQVILVGGQTRMPLVRRFVAKFLAARNLKRRAAACASGRIFTAPRARS
jgi:hypothetical protein